MSVTYGGLTINYERLRRPATGVNQRTARVNVARTLLWIAESEDLLRFRARVPKLEHVDAFALAAMEVAQADTTLVTLTTIAQNLDAVHADGKQETARWWSAARHYLDTTTAEWPPSAEILNGPRPANATVGSGVGSYPSHRGVLPPPEIRTSGQPRWLWGNVRRWAMQNARMNHLGTEVRKLTQTARADSDTDGKTNGKPVVRAASQFLVQLVDGGRYLRLDTEEVPPLVLGLLLGAGRDIDAALYRPDLDCGTAAPAAD